MQTIEVRGEIRQAGGKGGARRARASGRTPGILYGAGEAGLPISVDSKSFAHMLRQHPSGAFIIDLKIAGREGDDTKALIKEVQRDPLTSKILHVDLQHVSLDQKVVLHVPIHLVGTPVGVKEGGVLEHFVRDVEIQCLALQMPEGIDLDVSGLGRGHSLHVSDLSAPEGVTILTPGTRVIATIVTKVVEAEPEAAAPAAAEAAAPAAAEEKAE